jgi:hypothetical protein
MSRRFQLDGLMASVSASTRKANAQPLPKIGAGAAKVKAYVPPEESESQMQIRLMKWWKVMHRQLGVSDERLLMAFPLQGARTARNGARMKAEGLRAGTPDMFLAVSRTSKTWGTRHGLWMELKKQGGKASDEQKAALLAFREQGYDAYLCIGYAQAQNCIMDYLNSGSANQETTLPDTASR